MAKKGVVKKANRNRKPAVQNRRPPRIEDRYSTHGKHGYKGARRPRQEDDDRACDFCGEEECECHGIVTGFPANCSKD